jgi:hypothetical protein
MLTIRLLGSISKNSTSKPLLKKAFAVDENVYDGVNTFLEIPRDFKYIADNSSAPVAL